MMADIDLFVCLFYFSIYVMRGFVVCLFMMMVDFVDIYCFMFSC